MVRRRWTTGAAAALLVAVVLSMVAASSSAMARSRPRAKPATQRTLNLIATQRTLTLPLEPTLGSGFVWYAEVLDSSAARIGEAGASCGVVKVEAGRSTGVCAVVLRLRRGQLHCSGMIDFFGNTLDDQFDLAVVGGTGAYRAARGVAHVAVRVSFTYDLAVRLVW
jgi:hypothetical protein